MPNKVTVYVNGRPQQFLPNVAANLVARGVATREAPKAPAAAPKPAASTAPAAPKTSSATATKAPTAPSPYETYAKARREANQGRGAAEAKIRKEAEQRQKASAASSSRPKTSVSAGTMSGMTGVRGYMSNAGRKKFDEAASGVSVAQPDATRTAPKPNALATGAAKAVKKAADAAETEKPWYENLDLTAGFAEERGAADRYQAAMAQQEKERSDYDQYMEEHGDELRAYKKELEAKKADLDARGAQMSTDAARTRLILKEELAKVNDVLDGGGGFWAAMGREANWRNWTFGVVDVDEAAALMAIKDKMDAGEELTADEQMLVETVAAQNSNAELVNAGRSQMDRTGEAVMASLPFTASFMATGGFAGVEQAAAGATARAISKGAARAAATKVGAKAAEKAIVRNVGKAAANVVSKTAGVVAAGTAQTLATSSAHMAADAISRNNGDFHYATDKNGKQLFDENGNAVITTKRWVKDEQGNLVEEETSEDWLPAIAKSFGSAFFDNATEMVGKYMRFMPESWSQAAKRMSPRVFGVSKAEAEALEAAGKQVPRGLLERMGIDGLGEEIAEEELNLILNSVSGIEEQNWGAAAKYGAASAIKWLDSATGNKTASDEEAVNNTKWWQNMSEQEEAEGKGFWQNQLDIITSVSASVGMMSLTSTAVEQGYNYGKGKYAYYASKRSLDNADKMARYTFDTGVDGGARWDELRDKIDSTENEQMGNMAKSVVNDPKLTAQEKNVAVEYIRNLQTHRGLNAGMSKAKQTPSQQADIEATAAGYEAPPEMRADIKDRYDIAEERFKKAFGIGNKKDVNEWLSETYPDTDGSSSSYMEVMKVAKGGFGDFMNKLIGQYDVAEDGVDLDDETRAIAMEYFNARSALEGVQMRMSEEVEDQVEDSNQWVARNSYMEHNGGKYVEVDGSEGQLPVMMISAKTKDGKDVYIVRGDARTMYAETDTEFDANPYAEGQFKLAHTGQSLIVRDAMTGEMKHISDKDLEDDVVQIDAESFRESRELQIRHASMQEKQRQIDGTPPFNAGDMYYFVDERGNAHTASIAEVQMDDGAGNVTAVPVVSINGLRPIPLTDEIKDFISNDIRRTRQMQTAAEDVAEDAAETSAEPATPVEPRTYALDDEVNAISDSGKSIRGKVTNVDEMDGTVTVEWEDGSVDGNIVQQYAPEELDELFANYQQKAAQDEAMTYDDAIESGFDASAENAANDASAENAANDAFDEEDADELEDDYMQSRYDAAAETAASDAFDEEDADELDNAAAQSGFDAEGQDAVRDAMAEDAADAAAPFVMPTRGGHEDFKSAGVDNTLRYLEEAFADEDDAVEAIAETIKANADEAQRALDKWEKKRPKRGTSPMAYKASLAKWKETADQLQDEVDFWDTVKKRNADRMKDDDIYLTENRSAREILSQLGEPRDLEEAVVMAMPGYKYIWGNSPTSATKGVGSMIGANSEAERQKRVGWLGKKDNEALYPEQVAERIHASLPNNDSVSYQDVLDIVLDTLLRNNSPRAAVEAIANNRSGTAERNRTAEEEHYAALHEEEARNAGFENVDEYDAWRSSVDADALDALDTIRANEAADDEAEAVASGFDAEAQDAISARVGSDVVDGEFSHATHQLRAMKNDAMAFFGDVKTGWVFKNDTGTTATVIEKNADKDAPSVKIGVTQTNAKGKTYNRPDKVMSPYDFANWLDFNNMKLVDTGDEVSEENLNLNGDTYSIEEIETTVSDYVKSAIEEHGLDAEVVGVKVIGSRTRGEATEDSDIDVLVEYKGREKEDTMFNAISDWLAENDAQTINGVPLDINPITKGKSGTIEEFMKRNEGFTKKEDAVAEPKKITNNVLGINVPAGLSEVFDKETAESMVAEAHEKHTSGIITDGPLSSDPARLEAEHERVDNELDELRSKENTDGNDIVKYFDLLGRKAALAEAMMRLAEQRAKLEREAKGGNDIPPYDKSKESGILYASNYLRDAYDHGTPERLEQAKKDFVDRLKDFKKKKGLKYIEYFLDARYVNYTSDRVEETPAQEFMRKALEERLVELGGDLAAYKRKHGVVEPQLTDGYSFGEQFYENGMNPVLHDGKTSGISFSGGGHFAFVDVFAKNDTEKAKELAEKHGLRYTKTSGGGVKVIADVSDSTEASAVEAVNKIIPFYEELSKETAKKAPARAERGKKAAAKAQEQQLDLFAAADFIDEAIKSEEPAKSKTTAKKKRKTPSAEDFNVIGNTGTRYTTPEGVMQIDRLDYDRVPVSYFDADGKLISSKTWDTIELADKISSGEFVKIAPEGATAPKETDVHWDLRHDSKTGEITIQRYKENPNGTRTYNARGKHTFKNAEEALAVLRNPANKMQPLLDEYEKTLTNIVEYDAAQAEKEKPITPESGESPLDFADRVAADTREKQAEAEPMLTAKEIEKSNQPQFLKDNALDYINGKHDTVTEMAYNVIATERRAAKPAPKKKTTKPAGEKKATSKKKTSEKKPKSEKKVVTSQPQAKKALSTEERRAALREKLLRQKEEFKNIGKGRLSSLPIDIAIEKAVKTAEIMATSAEIGYTYLLDGITKAKEWAARMKEDFGDIFKDTFEYETDEEVDKYISDLWNASYTDEETGEKHSLAEWSEIVKPAEAPAPYSKGDRVIYKGEIAKVHRVEKGVSGGYELTLDTGMAPVIYEVASIDEVTPAITFHHETVEQPASAAVAMAETKESESSPVETTPSAEPKTKAEWLSRIYEHYEEWCKKQGVPSEPMYENPYGSMSPKATKGYNMDGLKSYEKTYRENVAASRVEPATEKQENFIKKLIGNNLEYQGMMERAELSKVAASYLIKLLKAENEAVYDHYSNAGTFEQFYNEIKTVFDLNTPEEEAKPAKEEKFTAEQKAKFRDMLAADFVIAAATGERPYKSIVQLRNAAEKVGMMVDEQGRDDILIQEIVEDALVRAARDVMRAKDGSGQFSKAMFDKIVGLYEAQPTIAQRSSNRIVMQQYSTPLPMGFVADMFAYRKGKTSSVLEPTAGNGMLVFGVPASLVHANELDETRLDNLRGQDFMQVTNQNALDGFEGGQIYSAVIANPPFGHVPAKEYDGKMIAGLEEQILLNALNSMRDDGTAAIIIGGNMEYAKNGSVAGNKAFWTYLYDHYNVKGVVDMEGKLYQRQGTTYPTRMILIEGRRSEDERAQTKVYPPVKDKAVRKATTFDELYEIVNEIKNSNERTNGNEVLRSGSGQPVSDLLPQTGQGNRGADKGQSRSNDSTPARAGRNGGSQSPEDAPSGVRPVRGGSERDKTNGTSRRKADTSRNDGGGSNGGTRNNANQQLASVRSTPSDRIKVAPKVELSAEEKRSLTSEKLPYRRHSNAFSLQSVAPAYMVEAMDKQLQEIEKEYGPIDDFMRNELGYDTVEDLHNALAAEQVDSVAMAVYQMKKGKAFIIGDQTGVGKGRQMASLIRWAHRQGQKPVFFTQKADLFTDIYRDLLDVGSGDLKPFIVNADGAMLDANGDAVYKPLSPAAQKKVFESGEIPDDYDFVVVTYSQVNTGDAISAEEANEKKKASGQRGDNKKVGRMKAKPTPKATWIRKIVDGNYLFMDESHTGAGQSNTGYYMQSISRSAKAVTYASATFAKRPDTMPLYAMRTAMSEASVKPDELIGIIEKGGVTLQEIMSRALTEAGQMVRRERDMSDVITDWETIEDPEIVKNARENYDKTIDAFNSIIAFQKLYIDPLIEEQSKELAAIAESMEKTRGTNKMGVENTPFASKTYNYTKQLMLALKAEAIADRVEAEINAGRHPVIALESTMESSLEGYEPGDVIDEPTFSASLLKGLQSCMKYTIKDENGNPTNAYYTPQELGPAGEAAYYELEDKIREATRDIFISPLDAIINELNKRGYSVGELTGRSKIVEVDEYGEATVRKRTDKDKKKLQREFNNGTLDVLILNKSASTGISLHASNRFSDQRQRTMIIAQPLSDINDYMQMIGRIDRTGQVTRGYYINLGLPVPAENRFLMMLSTKLKSLNANTTSAQDSESNEVEAPDLLNKYGSQVVIEYLRDHKDIYTKMGEPLRSDKGNVSAAELDQYKAGEDDARKVTGYVALLSTAEQEAFYADVVQRYSDLIQYLNDTGENDLKITVMPLRAVTVGKKVSSEGTDPNGNNPFAQHAYVEKVEMDVLRKPMKATEVRKTIETVNGGATDANGQRVHEITAKIDADVDAKIGKENERHEKAVASNEERIAKERDKILARKKMEEADKQKAIIAFREKTVNAENERHEKNLRSIRETGNNFASRIEAFRVGDTYIMPNPLGSAKYDYSSPAIFCGYKVNSDHPTPSTTLAVFAVLDGRRRIEVKMSNTEAANSILTATSDNYDAAKSTDLSNWDTQIPTETRKTGYIMTGNILQAVSDTQDDSGAYPGQLISYTDMDGGVHDGILMPDKWTPGKLRNSGTPIASKIAQIKALTWSSEPIVSTDGKVKIRSGHGRGIEIEVPKSVKEGGVFFKNKSLLDLTDFGFHQYRGRFTADVQPGNIEAAIKVLDDLGVRVKSEEENEDDVLFRDDEDELSVSDQFARAIEGLKPHAPIITIDSVESLELNYGWLKNNYPAYYKELLDLYNDPDGAHASFIHPTDNGGNVIVREIVVFIRAGENLDYLHTNLVHELVHEAVLDGVVSEDEINLVYNSDNGRVKKMIDAVKADEYDESEYKEETLCAVFQSFSVEHIGSVTRKQLSELIADKDILPIIKKLQKYVYDDEETSKWPTFYVDRSRRRQDLYGDYAEASQSGEAQEDPGWDPLYRLANEEERGKLEKEPTIKVYRAMQLVENEDGTKMLVPPMAGKIEGKWQTGIKLDADGNIAPGQWEVSDERPDLLTKNGKFRLFKGNGKSVDAAYNPYFHTSPTPLNDQFSEAQARPNLVTVEVEVPASELTSGYRAEGAKDAVGRMEWKAGIIQGQLTGTRSVVLSRFDKPTRIVPDAEVAKVILGMFDGKSITMPSNVVTPSLRAELEKLGVPFVETDNKGRLTEGDNKGEYYSKVYGKSAAKLREAEQAFLDARDSGKFKRKKGFPTIDHLARHLKMWQDAFGDNVNFVVHRDGSEFTGRKAKAKGWFDPSDGKVHIILDNHYTDTDLQRTIFHEVAAHLGLRKMLGKDFYTFLNNVYDNAEKRIQREIDLLASQKYKGNRHTATEEYMAKIAESMAGEVGINGAPTSLWKKMLSYAKKELIKLLRNIGIKLRFELTDNDLAYIMWESYRNTRSGKPNVFEAADGFDMQRRLRVRHFDHSLPKVSEAEEEALYRDGDGTAYGYYESRMPNKQDKWTAKFLYRFTEAWQDSMKSLKTLQDAISKESGKKLLDFEDAYKAENRMSSMNASAAEVYEREYYRPMVGEIAKLVGEGVSYDDVVKYAMAKHGIERNRVMLNREVDNKVADYREELEEGLSEDERLDPDIMGEINDKCKLYREEQREKLDRDFSGISSIFDAVDYESAAQDFVDAFEGQHDTTALWDKINAATKNQIDRAYDAGLIDKETRDQIKSMYEYYIPLRGFDETTAEDMYQYMTSESSPYNTPIKTAHGRSSVADDPFATIGNMAESGIMQANRNKMKQHLYRAALNHKTDLLTVGKQWFVLDNASGQWVAEFPEVTDGMTPAEYKQAIDLFEVKMRQLEAQDLATQNPPKADVRYRAFDKQKQEHTIVVKVNGKDYNIFINGNPRAAQAVNGQLNPDTVTKEGLFKVGKSLNNWMARNFTSRNPAFILTNLSRDVIFSGTAVMVKENSGYFRRFSANASKAFASGLLPRLIHKWNKGTLNDNNEIERYFKEFMMMGGETGYTRLNTVEDYKKKIESQLRELKKGKNLPRKAWDGLWESVEFLNRSAEDTTRFMVYMTSRQMGRSKERSTWDAKEITVNFNKKGSGAMGAKWVNLFYVFSNAAVQGLKNFSTLVKDHPANMTLALAAISLSGLLSPMYSTLLQSLFPGGDDDDKLDYWDLPEWVRRNNIVFYIPFTGNKFITIPLPHELRPFYGMGEMFYSSLQGKMKSSEVPAATFEAFGNLLPLDFTGNGGNKVVSFSPTYVQPLVQVWQNIDYFGTPIYKNNPYNESDPEWTKAYSGTTSWLVDGTRWLNHVTGGNDSKPGVVDLNPAIIEHLFESYFGGTGQTISQAGKTLSMIWNSDMREIRNVPVLNKFMQSAEERNSNSGVSNQYFRYLDETKETERLVKAYGKRLDEPEYAALHTNLVNSDDYMRYSIMKEYEKPMEALREAEKSAADDVLAKLYKKRQVEMMKEIVERIEDVSKGNKSEKNRKAFKMAQYKETYTRMKAKETEYNKAVKAGTATREMEDAEIKRQMSPEYTIYELWKEYESQKRKAKNAAEKYGEDPEDDYAELYEEYYKMMYDAETKK